MFKVGDQVALNEEYGGLSKGTDGIIIHREKSKSPIYSDEFLITVQSRNHGKFICYESRLKFFNEALIKELLGVPNDN